MHLQLAQHFLGQIVNYDSEVTKIIKAPESTLCTHLMDFCATIDEHLVRQTMESIEFGYMGGIPERADFPIIELAQIWCAKQILPSIIAGYRLGELAKGHDSCVKPYCNLTISRFNPDKNMLVDLGPLYNGKSGLLHNNMTYSLPPVTPASNSSYNLILRLCKNTENVKIRLDPFLVSPRDYDLSYGLKWSVYHTPMDRTDLHSLMEVKHAKWIPDDIDTGEIQKSEAIWIPNNNEVTFISEEVPKVDLYKSRAGRYIHAVYNKKRRCFEHLDGALRIYDGKSLCLRKDAHLKDSGKIGTRIKIFQIDRDITIDEWCEVVGAFFVFNKDFEDYFKIKYYASQ